MLSIAISWRDPEHQRFHRTGVTTRAPVRLRARLRTPMAGVLSMTKTITAARTMNTTCLVGDRSIVSEPTCIGCQRGSVNRAERLEIEVVRSPVWWKIISPILNSCWTLHHRRQSRLQVQQRQHRSQVSQCARPAAGRSRGQAPPPRQQHHASSRRKTPMHVHLQVIERGRLAGPRHHPRRQQLQRGRHAAECRRTDHCGASPRLRARHR